MVYRLSCLADRTIRYELEIKWDSFTERVIHSEIFNNIRIDSVFTTWVDEAVFYGVWVRMTGLCIELTRVIWHTSPCETHGLYTFAFTERTVYI
jgi:hypothetical protein